MREKILYHIRREKRRTLAIHVEADGRVLVCAPTKLALEEIKSYVAEKRHWIRKHVEEIRSRIASYKPHTFVEGDAFLYLGTNKRLVFGSREVTIVGDELHVPKGSPKFTKKRIEDFYKKEARAYFEVMLKEIEPAMRTRATRLWLSGAKRRWGSCNRLNGLNINWRLIMAPPPVIRSVIVHELAHTIRKDHSQAFWKIVKFHCPSYARQKKWLRDNELTLTWK